MMVANLQREMRARRRLLTVLRPLSFESGMTMLLEGACSAAQHTGLRRDDILALVGRIWDELELLNPKPRGDA